MRIVIHFDKDYLLWWVLLSFGMSKWTYTSSDSVGKVYEIRIIQICLTWFWDLDPESECVADPDGLHFPQSSVEDANPWWRSLGGRRDGDHVWVPEEEKENTEEHQLVWNHSEQWQREGSE